VQVDLINPTLKAPGTQRFNVKCDICFQCYFNFAFNFNLRRYTLPESFHSDFPIEHEYQPFLSGREVSIITQHTIAWCVS
jgi:hypothetical protein